MLEVEIPLYLPQYGGGADIKLCGCCRQHGYTGRSKRIGIIRIKGGSELVTSSPKRKHRTREKENHSIWKDVSNNGRNLSRNWSRHR